MTAEHGREIGWYRDPDQPLLHRYWDGQRWRTPCAEAQRRSDDQLVVQPGSPREAAGLVPSS